MLTGLVLSRVSANQLVNTYIGAKSGSRGAVYGANNFFCREFRPTDYHHDVRTYIAGVPLRCGWRRRVDAALTTSLAVTTKLTVTLYRQVLCTYYSDNNKNFSL